MRWCHQALAGHLFLSALLLLQNCAGPPASTAASDGDLTPTLSVKELMEHIVDPIADKIDKACESCHLEYWYPGDRDAVRENQRKTVTYEKAR